VVYKRGKYYWFKFQSKGEMLYFSTGQGDARIAANLEAKKRIELAENRGGIKRKWSLRHFEDISTTILFLGRRLSSAVNQRL
jgi:hypothetical protein